MTLAARIIRAMKRLFRFAGFAAAFAVAVLAVQTVVFTSEARAQDALGDPCTYEEFTETLSNLSPMKFTQLSLQFDNCEAKGWGAKKGDAFSFSYICYCDIKAKSEAPDGGSGCGPLARDHPKNRCRFGVPDNPGNQECSYYFGDTLQHLPQWTEQNKDSCFASNCQKGQEPSGVNMNGETECACPAGKGVLDDGNCGDCPVGEVIDAAGNCSACPAGKGIRDNGNCGNCPAGEGILADGKCGNCADDQFINPASVCTDSPLIGCQEDTGAGAACFEDACANAGWDSDAETFWCDINSRNAANGAEKGRCLAPTTAANATIRIARKFLAPIPKTSSATTIIFHKNRRTEASRIMFTTATRTEPAG